MKRILQSAKAIFFKLGERSAIILVILSSLFLIYSETASVAYSQEQKVVFERVEGSWYEKEAQFKTVEPKDKFSYSFTTGTVTPTPSPSPIPVAAASSENAEIWDKLAACESKNNWSINTGNGYYGGLQFSEGAWRSVGGSGLPHEHSRDEQIMRGKMLQEKRGWGPWGACSRKLGLF